MGDEKVKIPGDIYDATGEDLGEPVANLLHSLALLGTENEYDNAAKLLGGETPQSIALIEVGVTRLTKVWAWAAGVGISITAIGASLAGFWEDIEDPVRIGVVGSLALVLVALVVGIAWIITNDVRVRGRAASAQIAARAAVAVKYLQLVEAQKAAAAAPKAGEAELDLDVVALLAAITGGSTVNVTLTGGGSGQVTGLRDDADEGLQVRVVSGSDRDWRPLGSVTSFQTS